MSVVAEDWEYSFHAEFLTIWFMFTALANALQSRPFQSYSHVPLVFKLCILFEWITLTQCLFDVLYF